MTISRAGGDGHTISGLDEKLESQFRHATVLIVEDEGPLRQAVTKMLRNTGFEVFDVADGSSAIDLLRANGGNIDLILLDMTIPGAPSSEVVAEAAKVRPRHKSGTDQRLQPGNDCGRNERSANQRFHSQAVPIRRSREKASEYFGGIRTVCKTAAPAALSGSAS